MKVCEQIVTKNLLKILIIFSTLVFGLTNAQAQPSGFTELLQQKKRIHVVYFGGSDCPPCVAFRAAEFPKFKNSAEFSSVEWTFIPKVIKSPIPSSFFLPDDIKPLRDVLLKATGGSTGSAQVIIFLDGQVHDVFFGSKDSAFYQQAVRSILQGKESYPTERCVEREKGWACKTKG